MSFATDVVDRFRGYFGPFVDVVRRRLLGANNERIDFLMDSFYKLSPQQQAGAVLSGIAGLVLLVIMVFAIYFTRIHMLESELNEGFQALQDLRVLKAKFTQEKESLDWLVGVVDRKTSDLKPKPFFEQNANKIGVTLEALRSDEVDIPEDSPLSKHFRNVNIEFRLPKVSIPRMLNFFSEIEKSDRTLLVQELQIRARYGDRLYFDTQAKVAGFKVKGRE